MTLPAGAALVDRIRRIKQVVEAFDAGDISAVKAVSRIEDIASGEDDRIVHVGNIHKPEINT
jgi:hypothetical protein